MDKVERKKQRYLKRMMVFTFFSLTMNFFTSLVKMLLGLASENPFWVISGIFTLGVLGSKFACLRALRKKKYQSYKARLISFMFLLVSGIMYTIYMSRLIFTDIPLYDYSKYLGIAIALVSFSELGFAINGLIKVRKSGSFYRSIKIINFSCALTAIVLAQTAILSFTGSPSVRLTSALTGMLVGAIVIILSIIMFLAPDLGVIDRSVRHYYMEKPEDNFIVGPSGHVKIIGWRSKIVGTYYYEGRLNGTILEGQIYKEKGIFSKSNIFLKILFILFSEILVFVYLVAYSLYAIRCTNLPNKLDKVMGQNGFVLMEDLEL